VPNTPNWANVESNNVLQNALESIATKKSSVGGRGEIRRRSDREDAQREQLSPTHADRG